METARTTPEQDSLGAGPRPVTLDAEWLRVAALVALTEALRTSDVLPDGFEENFDRVQDEVSRCRDGGAWRNLRAVVSEPALRQMMPFDLDLIALVLAPEACPSLAPRIHALQSYVGGPYPALPIVQELLMLEAGDDIARLTARLEPSAPLISQQLLIMERQGDYTVLRPSSRLVQAVLGRGAELGPPPGAHLVPSSGVWADLIVPAQTMTALKDFVAWIYQRECVFKDWKARPLGGPIALFSGASGVGKSYAVSILTSELSRQSDEPWVLYRLDLGRIVSKYVGETEKNLNALLDALHGVRAVLQIDEADGLLGKRGEVSDARDRYANLEVSHMLSRFEQHDGPVILTSNLRSNIDAAFLRRFQIVVDFPGPDEAMRATLWQRLLPSEAPLDEMVDVVRVGEAVPLSGGGIHNAVVYAAVLAARDEAAIGYAHIARAAWRELNKESRNVRRAELGFLTDHLEETV